MQVTCKYLNRTDIKYNHCHRKSIVKKQEDKVESFATVYAGVASGPHIVVVESTSNELNFKLALGVRGNSASPFTCH